MKKEMGTNRFSYSFNDPVNKRDANGNFVPLVVEGFSALGGFKAIATFVFIGA